MSNTKLHNNNDSHSHTTHVTFVIGRPCSGKSTYSEHRMLSLNARSIPTIIIDTGRLASLIANTQHDDERAISKSYDERIASSCVSQIISHNAQHRDTNDVSCVIVCGVRTRDVVDKIVASLNDDVMYTFACDVLDVPTNVCRMRYEQRRDKRDASRTYDELLRIERENHFDYDYYIDMYNATIYSNDTPVNVRHIINYDECETLIR